MIKNMLLSAVAGAVMIGGATAAFAATGEFDNMCAMGLALDKEVETDCSVNTEYNGKTYCFGNEQAKEIFLKNPEANLKKAEAAYSRMHGDAMEGGEMHGDDMHGDKM
ncbi:hypothetical protein A7A08_02316 [Methyloligella halotolerans]|uniref:Uncharacterized protein n=1 Tax=Methyloligella halotolerans TaxID=1177755 RepID=A0A1E2RY92_9HYPH|nr:hypothetical protein [Methyloligella halotolerans]ODA67019.1 hypothetical protein A7A08_02316 [Methyloligella halotolerans]